MNIVTKVILSFFLTSIASATSAPYQFKGEFAYSNGESTSLYDVYCGHTATKDFCAIETLYIERKKIGCEIKPTSWDSGASVYEVTFNPSDKSFVINSNWSGSNKKLEYVITKNVLKSFDGDSSVTYLPKTTKISITCTDVSLITHLRKMISDPKSTH